MTKYVCTVCGYIAEGSIPEFCPVCKAPASKFIEKKDNTYVTEHVVGIAKDVPEEIKQERRARLMELQATISAARLRRKIGRTVTVLVDAIDTGGTAIARSAADAPEVDGVVAIERGGAFAAGEFVDVRIVDTDEHDLYAEPL